MCKTPYPEFFVENKAPWTTRGRNVTEEDLQAMLEGREDLSEVQDNPFAEMMREDDAAEAAMSAASTTAPADASTGTPSEPVPLAEAVQSEGAAPLEDAHLDATQPTDDAPASDAPAETLVAPAEPEMPAAEAPANAEPEQQMSDEEFEAFMKKAQAFYDTQAKSSDNEDSPAEDAAPEDDDEFPSLEVHSSND